MIENENIGIIDASDDLGLSSETIGEALDEIEEQRAEEERKGDDLPSKSGAMRPAHLLAYQFWRDHKKSVEATAKHMGVSRQTIWQWRKRFDWDRMYDLEEFTDPVFAQKVKRLSQEIQFAMLQGLHRIYCGGEPSDNFYDISNAKFHKDARSIVVGIEESLLEPKRDDGSRDKSAPKIVAINIE